jgi:DNA-binding GntR family transcriptional regulator
VNSRSTPRVAGTGRRRGRRRIEVMLKAEPVRRETVVDRAHAQLRDLVIRGALEPGVTYTIRGLAEALGTSATPVRSVLHMLVAEGALETLPNRSVRVPLVSAQRYEELCAIRAELEGLAGSIAAIKATPRLVEELKTVNSQYAAAIARGDKQSIFNANRRFHFDLYAHSDAPTLVRLIKTVWLWTGPYVNVTYANRVASAAAVLNHRRIVRAVARHDADECRRAIERDVLEASRFTVRELRSDAPVASSGTARHKSSKSGVLAHVGFARDPR